MGNKNAAGSHKGGSKKSILKGRVSTKYKKAVAKGLSAGKGKNPYNKGKAWNKVHKMQNSKNKSIKSRSANATRFNYLKESYK